LCAQSIHMYVYMYEIKLNKIKKKKFEIMTVNTWMYHLQKSLTNTKFNRDSEKINVFTLLCFI